MAGGRAVSVRGEGVFIPKDDANAILSMLDDFANAAQSVLPDTIIFKLDKCTDWIETAFYGENSLNRRKAEPKVRRRRTSWKPNLRVVN
jgi:hypothetical protein